MKTLNNIFQMNYKLRTSKPQQSIGKDILLAPGLNSFCVDQFGHYDLAFSGCHTYDSNDAHNSFRTGDERPVEITAIKHRNGVRILSDVKSSLKLIAEQNGERKYVTLVEEVNKVNGQFAYRYEFDLKSNEKLSLTPESDILLFTPATTDIFGANDCVEVGFHRFFFFYHFF